MEGLEQALGCGVEVVVLVPSQPDGATIGSCNLHASSVLGNTELNATFWDPGVVRPLRRELLAEHLGRDTGDLDDRAALGELRRIARENRGRRDAGDPDWRGLAFSLDPATYCR